MSVLNSSQHFLQALRAFLAFNLFLSTFLKLKCFLTNVTRKCRQCLRALMVYPGKNKKKNPISFTPLYSSESSSPLLHSPDPDFFLLELAHCSKTHISSSFIIHSVFSSAHFTGRDFVFTYGSLIKHWTMLEVTMPMQCQ